MTKFDWQIRQGDVLLPAFDGDVPEGAIKVGPSGTRFVLADGEVTGHAHVIEATDQVELYEKGGVLYLKVLGNGVVTHEEHAAVTVKPRVYTRPPQTEWSSAFEPRRVLD